MIIHTKFNVTHDLRAAELLTKECETKAIVFLAINEKPKRSIFSGFVFIPT